MEISNLALGGMNRAVESLNKAAGAIARAPLSAEAAQGDTVDLSEQMVALMVARQSFEANLKAAKTGDQMTQAVLDVLG